MKNRYHELYKQLKIQVSETTTLPQAQKLATELGLMYNAFGQLVMDMIKILKFKFSMPSTQTSKKNVNFGQINSITKLQQKISPVVPLVFSQKMKVLERQDQDDISSDEKQSQFEKKKQIFSNYEYKKPQMREEENKSSTIYERVVGIRKKADRQNLKGYSCADCEKFYDLLDEKNACDCTSRHRSNLPKTNYFSGFTQQFGFD